MTPPPSIQTTAAACEARKWFHPESTSFRPMTNVNAGARHEAEEARPRRGRTQTAG